MANFKWPALAVSASNPSIGGNNAATPTSATLVAGTDGALLRPIKVSTTGVQIVDGSAVTQPISAVALPLPAGAATETTLAAASAKLPATLGAKVTAASLAVTVASDQVLNVAMPADASSSLSISSPDVGSASNTVANGQVWITGTPTANSAAVFPLSSVETGMVQISGSWVGTMVVETSQDGGTVWTAHGIHLIGSPVFSSTFTNNVVGSLSLTAKSHVRVRATALTSGSVVVRVGTSDNSNAVYVANAVKLADSASTSPALMNIKAASTAPAATDTAIVVALNPNNAANVVPYNVAATALPLPTGAATEATLAALNAKMPGLGQTTMAASQPVVIASNQSALPVAMTDVAASGSITTQNLNPTTGAATAGSTVAATGLTAAATAIIQVTGTYTGALSVQVTVDGTNWVTLNGITNLNTGGSVSQISSALVGIWQAEVTGATGVRVSAGAAVTGTAVVSLRVSSNTGQTFISGPLPAGTAQIGGVNVSQINGVTPLMGNGVSGTGSLRVTLASDATSNTNPLLTKLGGKTVANRARNDYSTTSVTTGAYVQLLASTSSAITEIEIFDSSGQTLVLATGAAASEVDQIYVFPGGNGRVPLQIATATRVSIKAVSGTANVGECTINFYA